MLQDTRTLSNIAVRRLERVAMRAAHCRSMMHDHDLGKSVAGHVPYVDLSGVILARFSIASICS